MHDSLKPKAPDKYFNHFDSDSYDLNNFYAHVYGVDENIKRIVDYLESQNELNNTAPFAWALIKDVGTLIPDLYTDFPEGRKPVFELYNIKIDPAETNNLAREMPEKIEELSELYFKRANSFSPPFSSKAEKWKEIMPPVNNN